MKYKVGDEVTHFTGINGMVTKVLHDTNTYWFVYLKDNGELDRIDIEECEISLEENRKIGFGKNRK